MQEEKSNNDVIVPIDTQDSDISDSFEFKIDVNSSISVQQDSLSLSSEGENNVTIGAGGYKLEIESVSDENYSSSSLGLEVKGTGNTTLGISGAHAEQNDQTSSSASGNVGIGLFEFDLMPGSGEIAVSFGASVKPAFSQNQYPVESSSGEQGTYIERVISNTVTGNAEIDINLGSFSGSYGGSSKLITRDIFDQSVVGESAEVEVEKYSSFKTLDEGYQIKDEFTFLEGLTGTEATNDYYLSLEPQPPLGSALIRSFLNFFKPNGETSETITEPTLPSGSDIVGDIPASVAEGIGGAKEILGSAQTEGGGKSLEEVAAAQQALADKTIAPARDRIEALKEAQSTASEAEVAAIEAQIAAQEALIAAALRRLSKDDDNDNDDDDQDNDQNDDSTPAGGESGGGGGSSSSSSSSSSPSGRGGRGRVDSGYSSQSPNGLPLAIDLDGDGLETISLTDSDARYDMDGDGFREKTSWISDDDGWMRYAACLNLGAKHSAFATSKLI